MSTTKPVPDFKTFAEFWPFYLGEHSNPTNQKLHAFGTTVGLLMLVLTVVKGEPLLLVPALLSGYFFAWIGHFMVEHNRPATFQHPWFSLLGDFRLYADLWRGREKF